MTEQTFEEILDELPHITADMPHTVGASAIRNYLQEGMTDNAYGFAPLVAMASKGPIASALSTDRSKGMLSSLKSMLVDPLTHGLEAVKATAEGDQGYEWTGHEPPEYQTGPIFDAYSYLAGAGGASGLAAGGKGAKVAAAARAAATDLDPLGFYSKAKRSLNNMQEKGTGGQYMAQMLKAGVKPDELKWTGLADFLQGKQSVTKAEILAHMDANPVQVEKTVLDESFGQTIEYLQSELRVARAGQGEYAAMPPSLQRQKVAELEADIESMELLGGAGSGPPKFQDYTLPGGENYREVLWRLPEKIPAHQYDAAIEATRNAFRNAPIEQRNALNSYYKSQGGNGFLSALDAGAIHPDDFATIGLGGSDVQKKYQALSELRNQPNTSFTGSHFDQPNVLAHARVNDRVSANGEKTLFIEELQSDWAQKGRKAGFEDQLEAGYSPIDKLNAIPSAPFVDKTQKWVEFGLKNILRDAAEGGYDRVAWTPGKVQAERYDLSNKIGSIIARPTPDGKVHLEALSPDLGSQVMSDVVAADKLDDIIGKDLADKIRTDIKFPTSATDAGTPVELSGLDLQVGGEGMKAFYDKIIPNTVSKLVKKLDKDAKVEVTRFPEREIKFADRGKTFEERNEGVLSIPITPKMREAILNEGQALFAKGAPIPRAPEQPEQDDFEAILAQMPVIEPQPVQSYLGSQ